MIIVLVRIERDQICVHTFKCNVKLNCILYYEIFMIVVSYSLVVRNLYPVPICDKKMEKMSIFVFE